MITFLFAGCSGGPEPTATSTSITDAAQLFAKLRIDKHTIALSTTAPYDTVQLTAVPLSLGGDSLKGLPAPTFSSGNPKVVQVTPEGLVQAVGVGQTAVIAKVTLPGNLAHTDYAAVRVVDNPTPPRLASISIHPVPPDSAVTPLDSPYGATISYLMWQFVSGREPWPAITVTDSNGNPVTSLSVEVETLDPDTGLVANKGLSFFGLSYNFLVGGTAPEIVVVHPGQVRLVARTTAYGVTVADTVTWRITWPIHGGFEFQKNFAGTVALTPTEVRIAPGGVLDWAGMGIDINSDTTDTVEIVFDDPTNVAMPLPEICEAYDLANEHYYPFLDNTNYYKPGSQCQAGNIEVPHQPLKSPTDTRAHDRQVRTREFFVPGVYRFHATHKLTGQSLGEGTIIVTNNSSGEFP